MNQQLTEENKKKLEVELIRLKGLLKHEGHEDKTHEFPGGTKPDYPELGNEEGENASEVEQFGNELGVAHELEEKMHKVQSALKKIEDGTYGKCAQGDDIEEERLRALPEADTCMKHAV